VEFKKLFTYLVIVSLSLSLSACDLQAKSIPLGNSSGTKGSPDAPVMMIVYSDFQCPACKTAETVVEEILEKYSNEVFFVFRHFPLSGHRHSFSAAVSVECAGQQNKFWPYHDLLFHKQKEWGDNKLEISLQDPKNLFNQYAREVGLDGEQFQQCLQSKAVKESIRASKREGEKFRVTSTPTFFINNRRVVGGRSLKANYDAIIREALPKK